jgi:hypothetical protein
VDGVLEEWDGPAPISIEDDFNTLVGENEITGEIRFAYDSDYLYLGARLEDDEHHQPNTGSQLWKGDGFQWGVSACHPGWADAWREIDFALTPEGTQIYRRTQPSNKSDRHGLFDGAELAIQRDEDAGITSYEVGYPWSDTFGLTPEMDVISTNVALADHDDDGRTGLMQWAGGVFGSKDNSKFNAVGLGA